MKPNLGELMLAAESAHVKGNYEQSNSICHQVLEVSPRHLAAIVLLGITAVKTGKPESAIQYLSRAVRIDSHCFEAVLWLGIARKDNGETEEAISTLRQSLQLWPGHSGALANLGLAYLKLPDAVKAVRTFQRAIAEKPNEPDYHENLAFALQQAGDNETAVSAFKVALQLSPNRVTSLVGLGQIYLEMANRDAAIHVFRQAYELTPDTARGQIQLARALREEGDFLGSEAALKKALDLEPTSVDALEVVSNLFQQLGRFDEAFAAVEQAIALEPDRKRLYFNRIYARKATEKDEATLARMEEMTQAQGLSASDRRYLHYALGKANNDLGRLPIAMAHFDQANQAMREIMGHRRFEREIHSEEFDRKIATFTPEFFAQHAALGNPGQTPVLIVGMIRSGTSLVEQILSSHPSVVGAGELMFWFQRAHELVSRTKSAVNVSGLAACQTDYLNLLRGIDAQALRITDKMPHNYMFVGQIHLAFPNAKIIHCRRHPIDNCLSIYMTPYQAPLDFAHDKSNIRFVYQEYLRLTEHWQAVIPSNRWLNVDYETLVADPEMATREMVDFIGLPWDDACLRPEDNIRAVKTPSMWQVRQPVYKSSTERWRKYEPWLDEFAELKS